MNNKGYTIMEAVVAMFLVVVMVGAVFSALMSGRRAIVTSLEREEVLYSVQSAYGMLKDCRGNENCYLNSLGYGCTGDYTAGEDYHNLKGCNALFTFEFNSLCKGADNGVGSFEYRVRAPNDVSITVPLSITPGGTTSTSLSDVFDLTISTNCTEQL